MKYFTKKIKSENLKKVVDDSLSYLSNNMKKDGMFIYEYNPQTSTISEKYNMLRHIGTVYSMYSALNLSKNSIKIFDKANLGFEFSNKFLKSETTNCSTYKFIEYNGIIKLGGTALHLIALIEKNKIIPNENNYKLMMELGNFITWMQSSDGKFQSKYSLINQYFYPHNSLYYPSQAILALIRLYKIDKKEEWLKSIINGVDYLINVRDKNLGYSENLNDHWLIIALNELLEVEKNEIYIKHLRLLTHRIIKSNPVNDEKSVRNYKNFTIGQIATRAEGLAASVSLELQLNNISNCKQLISELENLLFFCFHFQYSKENNWDLNRLFPQAIGGFRKSIDNPVIRIDNVQHAISATQNLYKIYGAL